MYQEHNRMSVFIYYSCTNVNLFFQTLWGQTGRVMLRVRVLTRVRCNDSDFHKPPFLVFLPFRSQSSRKTLRIPSWRKKCLYILNSEIQGKGITRLLSGVVCSFRRDVWRGFWRSEHSSLELDSLRYFAWFSFFFQELRSRASFRNRTSTENWRLQRYNDRTCIGIRLSPTRYVNFLYKPFVLCTYYKSKAVLVRAYLGSKLNYTFFAFFLIWWPYGLLGVSRIVRGSSDGATVDTKFSWKNFKT